MGFMEALEKNQYSVTENGALGYKTTGSSLVDINFRSAGFRNMITSEDFELFDNSLSDDLNLTLRWLLYLRDIKGGMGERKSFRALLIHLCNDYPNIASSFFSFVPVASYGRWDDYIDVYFSITDESIKNIIAKTLSSQLACDLSNVSKGLSVSLLAKWLPSEFSKSAKIKHRAKVIRSNVFKMDAKTYRKSLSKLRAVCAKTEVLTSANKWGDINYEQVPSRANIKYFDAFYRHDNDRRMEYLNSVSKGVSKINANSMFLYDIIHSYKGLSDVDPTHEELWKAQDKAEGFSNTLVVRDGSYSMFTTVGNTKTMIMDIGDSIALYCAENNTGYYRDKFITFSYRPEFVNLSRCKTLYSKIHKLRGYDEYASSTNIESVFRLVLDTAVKNNVHQDDLPKNILIISDMEFNSAVRDSSDRLFGVIQNQFESAGYDLPKLIFWNVGSRTNTIPITENKNGVVLVSGFSKSIVDMVMSSELSPYLALKKVLMSDRYSCIDNVEWRTE